MLEDATPLDAGSGVDPFELDRDLGLDRLVEPDPLQVEVLDVSPDGVVLLFLDHDRNRVGTLDREVEKGMALDQDQPDLPVLHLERDCLVPFRVDHARDLA